ncbi:MAG: arsenate reductase ArsC [Planctomycetota bacterium]
MNSDRKRYLVLCTGNRCRSQMAHGWLAHFAGGTAEVFSAGTKPKGVHPLSIEVMREAGVDITHHTSDHVSEYLDQDFDAVITVCDHAQEACPAFPGAQRTEHHTFEDPDYPELAESDPEEFKRVFCRIRDEIRDWCKAFLVEEGIAVPA